MYEPSVIKLAKKVKKHFLVVVTRNNYIKKLDLDVTTIQSVALGIIILIPSIGSDVFIADTPNAVLL